MDNDPFRALALFKFSLIAPVVNDTYETSSKMQYFRQMASKSHRLPDGKSVTYSPNTLKKWYLSYTHLGIDGLLPKRRRDWGVPRVLNEEAITKIYAIKDKFPYITGKMVYHKLVEEGYVKASNVSLASVQRYIRDHHLKRNQLEPVERRAYEMEFANDCWQGDTSFGPKIMVDGRKVQTYLISLMDDASRLMMHAEFFFHDNALNFQAVLKKAVQKFGIPKRLFVDNGKPYKNAQLSMICAALGVHLIHSRPYSPQSKGKCERLFRTLKDGYLHACDWNKFASLLHLNDEFADYVHKGYVNKVHSATKLTPKNRFLQDMDRIKYLPEETLERCFLHRVVRTVGNDATIKLSNLVFEVPQKYIREKLHIRYTPLCLHEAYIFDATGNLITTIYPLNKVDNSKIKRKRLDYSQLGEDGHV